MIMEPIDGRSLVIWIGIVAMVVLFSFAGMYLNRYFIHRAHRRALEGLKSQRVKVVAHSGAVDCGSFCSEHAAQDVE